jgi:hypothetical protein
MPNGMLESVGEAPPLPPPAKRLPKQGYAVLRARCELEMDLSSVPDLVPRFGVSFPGKPPQGTQSDHPASTPNLGLAGQLFARAA